MARKTESAYVTEKNPFSERLREIMKVTDTKQKTLADAIGRQPQTVSLYLNGQSFPDVLTLRKICLHFDVSADWLLGRDGAVKSVKPDLAAAAKYTGLTEDACRILSEYAGVSSTSDARKIVLLSMCGYRSDVDPETLDSARILDCSCWIDTLSHLIESDELFTAFLRQVYGYKKSLDEAVGAAKETCKKLGGSLDKAPTFDEVRSCYEPAYRKARLAYFEAQDAARRLIDNYAKAGEYEYKRALGELLHIGGGPDGEHPETNE